MALDARSRSSIYQTLVPILGEHDANALMSEFPSVEADELVTKQFLRAELAEALHCQTLRVGGAIAGATALLAALGALI
ncbi:MAG TPA: hypothetical protein VFV32_02225 [Acidimicrobiales bacterium]|nr:hypothetical protein [Acidimicrobiales bacterium]